MTRVKSIAARRHRKVREQAKGYQNARRRRYSAAKEAVMHAGMYAFHGRRLKKRNLRSLWIVRLNAALRENDLTYSKFISMALKSKVELDRKVLSDIALSDPDTFKKILQEVK